LLAYEVLATPRRATTFLVLTMTLWTAAPISADTHPDKSLRYANPLVIENAGRLADPTVVEFQGKYYLYPTGGVGSGKSSGAAVWSSDDLVRWRHHRVSIEEDRGIVAPPAFDYNARTWWAPAADDAVEFDEIEPTECRYVRLTLTGWPQDLRRGVLELTVFGKPLPE